MHTSHANYSYSELFIDLLLGATTGTMHISDLESDFGVRVKVLSRKLLSRKFHNFFGNVFMRRTLHLNVVAVGTGVVARDGLQARVEIERGIHLQARETTGF